MSGADEPIILGLYPKYHVEKVDGTPLPDSAEVFVLRLDSDPNAQIAALHYAQAIKESNPVLADDLWDRVMHLRRRAA